MSGAPIVLQPVDMNRETMISLERKGLIRRIAPGADVAGPVDGANLGRSIYESDPRFGGHKLIVATVGATTLRHFGYHEDCEDVWLLGLDSWKPMYFVFGNCLAEEFGKKISEGTLSADDLVCLRVRYNDPEASFFAVNKYVPHGEFVVPRDAPDPSFYVTEPTNLRVCPLSFGSVVVKMLHREAIINVTP
jgi:hypothetical protein